MQLEPTDLLVIWLGGGFVLALAWAGTVGHLLLTDDRRGVQPAVAALAIVGLASPVGALAAVDVVRLARTIDDPVVPFPRWALPATQLAVVLSLAIAPWAWTQTGSI